MSGVIGGTISQLTGGKFANGASSAAFAAALRADWGRSGARANKLGGTINGKKIDRDDPEIKLIEALMIKGDADSRQQAINATIVYFGIDISHKGEFFYPVYDKSLDIYGFIDNGKIVLGKESFSRGIGMLGSTIFHEMVHIRQGWKGTGDFGHDQASIFEYFAFKAEISQANRFGLSSGETQFLQSSMNNYCNSISSSGRRELNISC